MAWQRAQLGDERQYVFRIAAGQPWDTVEAAVAAAADTAAEGLHASFSDDLVGHESVYTEIAVEVQTAEDGDGEVVVDVWSPIFAAILLRNSAALTTLLMFHIKFARRICATLAAAAGAAHMSVGDDSRFILISSGVEDDAAFSSVARALLPLIDLVLAVPAAMHEWLVTSLAAAVTAVHTGQGLSTPKRRRSSVSSVGSVGEASRPMAFVDSEALRELCSSSATTFAQLTQQLPIGLIVPVVFAMGGEASILQASLAIEWQHGRALHFYSEALPFLEHVQVHSALPVASRVCMGHIATVQRLMLSTVTLQDFTMAVEGLFHLALDPPATVPCIIAAAGVAGHVDLRDARGHLFASKVEVLLNAACTLEFFAGAPATRAAAFEELWAPSQPPEEKPQKFRSRVEMLHHVAVVKVVEARGATAVAAWAEVFGSFFLRLMPVVEERRMRASGRRRDGDHDEALDEDAVLGALATIVAQMHQRRVFRELPLEEKFAEAQQRFGAVAGKHDNATKLRFYGLFKQATIGDVNIAKPWAIDMAARAKFDAWSGHKGMSREAAMQQYVELFVTVCCGGVEPE